MTLTVPPTALVPAEPMLPAVPLGPRDAEEAPPDPAVESLPAGMRRHRH